ncbi:MAG: fused MFS/spermidine synthase, partial [Desulfocucumaceae bacterium]
MLHYYLLAFFSGAFTMTREMVASRLIAPYVGVSLYTWTSVIGIVLAGISAGSFTGGWMADRFNPGRLLSYTMILAGIVTAAILPELPLIMGLSWPASWLPALKVVVPVTILFGIPSFVIGCISPVIYRICIQDLTCTGRTVGRLAASGSLGSIAGTFATGFYLIPAMGTR